MFKKLMWIIYFILLLVVIFAAVLISYDNTAVITVNLVAFKQDFSISSFMGIFILVGFLISFIPCLFLYLKEVFFNKVLENRVYNLKKKVQYLEDDIDRLKAEAYSSSSSQRLEFGTSSSLLDDKSGDKSNA